MAFFEENYASLAAPSSFLPSFLASFLSGSGTPFILPIAPPARELPGAGLNPKRNYAARDNSKRFIMAGYEAVFFMPFAIAWASIRHSSIAAD